MLRTEERSTGVSVRVPEGFEQSEHHFHDDEHDDDPLESMTRTMLQQVGQRLR
jgi:hypothetical protein